MLSCGTTSPVTAAVLGKTFRFGTNDSGLDSLTLETSGPEGWLLTRTFSGKTESLRCGHARWMTGYGHLGDAPRGTIGSFGDEALGASAAWTSDDTWTVKVCARGTPLPNDLYPKVHRPGFNTHSPLPGAVRGITPCIHPRPPLTERERFCGEETGWLTDSFARRGECPAEARNQRTTLLFRKTTQPARPIHL